MWIYPGTRRFLILSICFVLVTTECPLGYLHYEDSCYYFSTNNLDWYRAESSCLGHNAKLAEVYTKQQSDFLLTEARRLGGSGYWLGGRDDIIERDWRWASTNKQFSYTAWFPGEPNSGGDEDCVHLRGLPTMLWNDINCLSSYRYICELP